MIDNNKEMSVKATSDFSQSEATSDLREQVRRCPDCFGQHY